MARLEFDFHARPQRPGRAAAVLLLTGVAALAWAWSNYQAARAAEAGLTLQIAALRNVPARPARTPATHADEAARLARTRVADQLKYSWQPAFDALAAARTSKIALVSLDALQTRSQLKLIAEARQLADAIAYIDALQHQPGVSRVELLQHEVQADDAQKPLRVSIVVELRA